MENTLQDDVPILKNSEKTFNILVHADRYTITGDWNVIESDRLASLDALQQKAISFNYLISLDDENYLIHPDETDIFETLIGQLAKVEHTHFTFRIVAANGQVKIVEGQGALSETTITSLRHSSIPAENKVGMQPSGAAELDSWAVDAHRNKELLRSIFETSRVGISLLTSERNAGGDIVDFRFQLVNKMVMKQTGSSTLGGMLGGKKYSELMSEVKFDMPFKDLVTVVNENKLISREILMDRHGMAFWLNLIMTKFEDGVLVMSEDITRHVDNEDQIEQQTMLFTKIIESSPDIIEIVNLQSGRSAYINKMLLEELQYPFEEIKRIETENKLKELIHPDDVDIYQTFLVQIYSAGNEDTIEAEVRWRAFDGTWAWFRTRARVFDRDESGTALKFLAFSQNVTDRKLSEEEKRKHQLLRDLEKTRTAFFNHVSHEFRTPLTLLLAPLQEILHRSDFSKTEREDLHMAYRNALRLQKLVNSLLDFSTLESGKLQAVFRPTDLTGFTTDLASNFRTIIEHAGLKFIVKCPESSEPVYINREMYEKILFNLLSNAFKFTFEGKIAVTIKDYKKYVKLVVSDSGIGIRSEDIHKIFERFSRIEGAKARTYEGSGIGLALVKELVWLHGASIKVSSIPGEGTEFTVSFLKGKSHLRKQDIFESKEHTRGPAAATPYLEELKGWTTNFEGIEDDRIPKRRHLGDFPVLKPLVLVVDDNSDMRTYLKSLLADDYQVVIAANGKAALDAIRGDRPPDLILSDVMMPEVDGYALLEAIKSNPLTAEVPVILISAKAGEESRIEGLRYGADDYLIKPFSAKEMLARVDARIQIARTRQVAKQVLLDVNRHLEQSVTERTSALQVANVSLLQKNIELESLNTDLTSFAFVASHDLSEPLRKIRTFTDLLLERESAPLSLRGKDLLAKITSSAERMKALIDEILTYSRTQSEPANMAEVDLNSLLEQVKTDLSSLIVDKNAVIECGKLPVVYCNPVQFAQLFQNMISNSVKFCPTDREPRIVISASMIEGNKIQHATASEQTKFLRIEISDNGIGFDPQYSERIFQMFQRLHTRTEYAGTGMGLAICKKVVENHQGFMLTDSKPGEGAMFCCYFPESMVVGGFDPSSS